MFWFVIVGGLFSVFCGHQKKGDKCVRLCVRACMRACVHACVRACMHACVRACVCAGVLCIESCSKCELARE